MTISMLDPYNTLENAGSPSSAPPQSTSTTSDPNENAPTYDRHYRDRRHTPSPADLANEVSPLEQHPPFSTITSANLPKSRKAPPPHFSSHLLPAYDASSYGQDENRPLSSPGLSNTSATTFPPSVTANPNPDFITLDKDLIFPPPPSNALYSLEFAVSATGKSNTLRQSVYRPDGTPHPSVPDKDLYNLSSELNMNSLVSGRYIIQGQRRSTFRGMLQLRRTVSLLGKVSWECCPLKDDKGKMDAKQNGKYATWAQWKDSREEALIKTKGTEWLDGSGNVIGREEGGIEMSRKDRKTKEKETKQKKQGHPVEYLPPKLELTGIAKTAEDGGKIRALLIACWVCKCWFWESQTGEKMPPAIKKTKHSYLPIFGDAIIHGD